MPSSASSARADRHRDAGEDRRVAQRVRARFGGPQLLDQVEELARVVALERDHELLVVEAERVRGVDRDLRVAAADLDVLGHHPPALLERQPVPLALLVERVDEQVLALGRADLRPGLGLRIRRRLGHRQIGVGDRHPLREAALGEHDVEGVDVLQHRALAQRAAGRCPRGCRPWSRRAGSGPGRSPRRRRGTRLYPAPALRRRGAARRVELEKRELRERAVGAAIRGDGSRSGACGRRPRRGCRAAPRARSRRTHPDGRVVIAIAARRRPRSSRSAAVDGISPGVISAGIGTVPPAQTYLDISQGNRVNESLYDEDLPPLYVRDGVDPAGAWERVASAPRTRRPRSSPGCSRRPSRTPAFAVAAEAAGRPRAADRRRPGGATSSGRAGACRATARRGCTSSASSCDELPAPGRGARAATTC